MAVYTAPGVYARDVDLSGIVMNQATAIGAIVGQAQRGSVNSRMLFTNVQSLVTTCGKPNTKYGYAVYCGICALEQMTQLYFTRVAVDATYASSIVNVAGITENNIRTFGTGNNTNTIFSGILGPLPILELTSVSNGSSSISVTVLNEHQIGLGTDVQVTFTGYLQTTVSSLVSIVNGATTVAAVVDETGNITGVGINYGIINMATGKVSVTFSTPPTSGNAIKITYNMSTGGSFTGAGILSGDIDYLTGVINVTFSAAPASLAEVSATYISDSPTQIVGTALTTDPPDAFPVATTQVIGTGNNTNPTFTHSLVPAPIVKLISIGIGDTIIPVLVDSLGNVTGHGISIGTLVPETGALSITLNVAPGTGTSVTANFSGSDTTHSAFMIYAENPGAWGDNIYYQVNECAWDPTLFNILVQEFVNGVYLTRENWLVSRIINKLDGYGNSTYLETKINGLSNYISVYDNDLLDQDVMPAFTAAGSNVRLTGGTDGVTVHSGDIITGWQMYTNPAIVDVNILMNVGYVADNDPSVQISMQALVEKRRDCFAIFDIPYDRTEITPRTLAADWRLNTQNIDSSFTALYSPWIEVYDSYNDIPGLPIPPSGFIGAVFALNDYTTYPWYAPAGFNRGILRSQTLPPTDVTQRYSDIGEIEALYANPVNINAIIFSPGYGIVVYGQKTQLSAPSALDRINVRRLIITFERAAKQFLKYKLFELNNYYTRLDITNALSQYLTLVQAQNGVYAFKVVCDATNNTPQIIDMNQLNVDVYLQPEKAAEFIQLQNIITATGVNFTVIQQRFNLTGTA